MKLKHAKSLQKGDEVIVKRTRQVLKVVEVDVVAATAPTKEISSVEIMLEDGNWYGHREII